MFCVSRLTFCNQGQDLIAIEQQAICAFKRNPDLQALHLACWLVAHPHPEAPRSHALSKQSVAGAAGRRSQSHLKTMQMITKPQGLDDHGGSFAQNVITAGAHTLPTD